MFSPSLLRRFYVAGCCLLVGCAGWPLAEQGPLELGPDRSQPAATAGQDCMPQSPLARAIAQAQAAAAQSQTAATAADWNAAAIAWMQAITTLQAVPLDSPQRTFALKKVAEYERNLAVAQQRAAVATDPLPFPSFGSQFLDEQLRLFLSVNAVLGPPEVLIVGSSRALQGVDPRQLQAARRQQGEASLRIFNFGVNGATAQTVDFLVRELLTPEQAPALILWADGARALNSGRPDRTQAAIASSPGYAALAQDQRPTLPPAPAGDAPDCPPPTSAATTLWELGLARWWPGARLAWAADVRAIDAYGFLAVGDRFDPNVYYQRFPRVAGRYDGDYQDLNFGGVQQAALMRLVQYTRSRQIPLVFVNLPLSEDYLDRTRAEAEVEFRAFMEQQAQALGFQFLDWGGQWRDRPEFFADPSHLNQAGAAAIASQLAATPNLPWPRPAPPPPPPPNPDVTLPPPPGE